MVVGEGRKIKKFIFIPFSLGNDLDSIRALFSEKEKELSLAVAKVEALTRQLEDLRRDRRGPLNLIPGGAPGGNQQQSAAARELDKLRRELMVSDKIPPSLSSLESLFPLR